VSARPPRWRVRPAILVPAGAILALVGLLALPRVRSLEPADGDPAARAATQVRALLDRLGKAPGEDGPGSGSPPAAPGPPPLRRNLFGPDLTGLAPSPEEGTTDPGGEPDRSPRDGAPASDSGTPGASWPADASTGPSSVPGDRPRLTGLLVDGAARHAVVDGRVVAEGDTLVDGWVVRITSAGVLLFVGDRFERLRPPEDP